MALLDDIHTYYLLHRNARGLQSRLDGASRHMQVHETRLNQVKTQHAELTEQLKQAQTHAQSQEHQARDVEDRIEKLRKQMTEVTNNKEYSALLVEVNTLKLEKGKLEDEALSHMTHAEQLQAELEQLQEKVNDQEKMVTTAAGEVDERKAEVGQELEKLIAQRDEAAKAIPDDILSTFERLADQHDGEAMAEVIEEDRRRHEYNCGGCYMTLPIEHVNALVMQPDKLTTCPSCQRILYLEEELKASMAPKSTSK